jgi:hypothetical protein
MRGLRRRDQRLGRRVFGHQGPARIGHRAGSA